MYPAGPEYVDVQPQVMRYSLHERGLAEAFIHKWIESEKAGKDLGVEAIRHWVRKHWHGFLRAKWLEHIEGRAFWIELQEHDFDLLRREFVGSRLASQIVDKLRLGQENLDIIGWAIDTNQDWEEVYRILHILDINSVRIEAMLESHLS